jgi:hypothetical protein
MDAALTMQMPEKHASLMVSLRPSSHGVLSSSTGFVHWPPAQLPLRWHWLSGSQTTPAQTERPLDSG